MYLLHVEWHTDGTPDLICDVEPVRR